VGGPPAVEDERRAGERRASGAEQPGDRLRDLGRLEQPLQRLRSEQHVLEQSTLPPGRYLLAVTLSGADNWDRQVLYFTVK